MLLLPTGPSHKMLLERPLQITNHNIAILQASSKKVFFGSICIITEFKLCNLPPHSHRDSAPPVSIPNTCSSFPYSVRSTNINLFPFSWTRYTFPNTESCHKIVLFFEIFSSPSFIKITSTYPILLVHYGLYCIVIGPIKSVIVWKSLKIIWKLNSNSNVLIRGNVLMFCCKIHAPFLTPLILL